MKNIKKYLRTGMAVAITLFASFNISAAKDVQAIIAQLKGQEAIISTIAKQPIYIGAFHADTPELKELKRFVEQDIKSIKEDFKNIRQAIIFIIQKQQETLLAIKE